MRLDRPDPDEPDRRTWLIRFGLVAMIGVGAGIIAAGLPTGTTRWVTLGLLVAAAAGWVVALSSRWDSPRVQVPALLVTGFSGAGLDVVQSRGPGFVAGYMALAGLALRLPRRTALLAGTPVLLAVAAAEARGSRTPTAAVISVTLGAGFLFLASTYAALDREARATAVRLLEQQEQIQQAREEAAALAERSRLARELHDVLAHSLAGLAVQLEAARLLADATHADPRLAEQVTRAHALARDGLLDARRAVRTLRGDAMPGPDAVAALVDEFRTTTGRPVTLEITGTPRPLPADAGLTIFRCVQESLTNITKYAGAGASVDLRLSWGEDDIRVEVRDRGGDGAGAGLPSGGAGLVGLRERAELAGGTLSAGPTDGGFDVVLTLPAPGAPR